MSLLATKVSPRSKPTIGHPMCYVGALLFEATEPSNSLVIDELHSTLTFEGSNSRVDLNYPTSYFNYITKL